MTRILVVDDSAAVRRIVCEILRCAGHETVAAVSGEEAVEKTLIEHFDLVVSDVRMGAMTGVQLCRVLRSDPLTHDLPVVLLTAADDSRSRFWGRHAGADAFLAKAEAADALPGVVHALLAKRPRGLDAPVRRPLRVDAAARVAAELDRQLFEAVVANEARALMAHIDERATLMRSVAEFCGTIVDASVVVFSMRGHGLPSHAIHSHHSWSDEQTAADVLGLEPSEDVQLHKSQRTVECDIGRLVAGPSAVVDVTLGNEVLGRLRLFDAEGVVRRGDLSTATLVAHALAPVLKTTLLVEETRRLANTDQLTGIANRRVLAERLELEDRRAARYGGALSAVMVDVDHFKSVNDRFGHSVGDEVLKAVADSLAGSVRNVDLVGRWGGEEFLVILPSCDAYGAQVVAERICRAVRELPAFPGGPAQVTVSCGFAARDSAPPTAARLVERADEALYRAKRAGRDRAEGHDMGAGVEALRS